MSYQVFSEGFRTARDAAGCPDLQARDFRRTAVTTLFEAGCEIGEISAITLHSVARTTEIIETYFVRTGPAATRAIEKWQDSESGESKG